jgi:DNA-binding response OmpR family regulator
MNVLIAEDDNITREGLEEILIREGYKVFTAENGVKALEVFTQESIDFICLDIMMPDLDGYSVCRKIRESGSQIPVIFISAKSEEIDKVLGLELGADDFIVKPFGVREIIARIRAVTRRCLAQQKQETASNSSAVFTLGPITINPSELRAWRDDQVIELSLRDLSLLQLFADNPNRVIHRHEIFDKCWGEEHIPESRTLDQHISRLRKRIELDPKNPQLILTVHGAGYRYNDVLQ